MSWRWSQSTGAWTVVRDYATSPTYTWTTTSANAGTHALQVWVGFGSSPQAATPALATGTRSLASRG